MLETGVPVTLVRTVLPGAVVPAVMLTPMPPKVLVELAPIVRLVAKFPKTV